MPFKENMYAQETASREEYTFLKYIKASEIMIKSKWRQAM